MVNIPIIINLLIAATGLVSGHPGEHHDASSIAAELQRRDAHAAEIQRGLDNCQTHPTYRTLKRRGLTRRYEKAQQLRRDRGIDTSKPYKTSFHSRRDLASLQHFESLNHNLTNKGYNVDTDPSTLFASFKNSSCILTPETTQGPYWVLGEYFRNDVVENQPGIPVHIEYQYIDISTCNAVNGIYQETWQANATGVYGGVEDTSNPANLNATWLRGISGVDSDGIGYFDTLFPGHYYGRTNHFHLMVHQGGSVVENGTYQGGSITHVGQIFFPEDLINMIEALEPYTFNTQPVTTNDEDGFAPPQADNNYDPFPDYAFLGNDVKDGLLMWIAVGLNMSANYQDITAAGSLTSSGGVPNNSPS